MLISTQPHSISIALTDRRRSSSSSSMTTHTKKDQILRFRHGACDFPIPQFELTYIEINIRLVSLHTIGADLCRTVSLSLSYSMNVRRDMEYSLFIPLFDYICTACHKSVLSKSKMCVCVWSWWKTANKVMKADCKELKMYFTTYDGIPVYVVQRFMFGFRNNRAICLCYPISMEGPKRNANWFPMNIYEGGEDWSI